jgi:fatty acid desaturase
MDGDKCLPMVTGHHDVTARDDDERLRSFGLELDALKRRTLASLGGDDVAYVKRIDRFSRTAEIFGRTLIHASFEPGAFFLGVLALAVHKQLQTGEIGHSALHGAWDRLPGAERYASRSFRWETPVDEASWRHAHNVRHHGMTNVAASDPDIHFGPVRLTEQTPYSGWNRIAIPFAAVVVIPNFLFVISTHVTGVNDLLADNGRPEKLDFLPDRSLQSARGAIGKAMRKWVPYYAKEYVLFPALAGPFFWKVLAGNWLAETGRNVYAAASILCGHAGADVKSWPPGTRARSRGEWYAMQVEAANDFEVSLPLSVLCGGLDKQIEHHLFPTLPPPRLREIAPEVRAICERHGVHYATGTWWRTLRRAFAQVARLSRRAPSSASRERVHAASGPRV